MNAFQIKVIAIIAMIIDHLGLFFFPQFLVFRMIGRLSFPLFAWLIANGAYHTHDIDKYLQRLYLFALISQVPFLLANRVIDPHFADLNVLCTLFFGLLAVAFIRRTGNWVHWLIITIIFASMAQLLQTDYGGFGVAVIVLFYVFYYNFKKLFIAQFILFFSQLFFSPVLGSLVEPLGLVSLVFIRLYNNQRGPGAQYLFYLFYPMQYIVFYFLLMSLSSSI